MGKQLAICYFAFSPAALAGGLLPEDSTVCVSVVVVEPPGVSTVSLRWVLTLFSQPTLTAAARHTAMHRTKKRFMIGNPMEKFCEEPAADRLRCAFAVRNTFLRLAPCLSEH